MVIAEKMEDAVDEKFQKPLFRIDISGDASLSAVSTEMTTSPKRCGEMSEKSPSRIGNAITLVGPDRFR